MELREWPEYSERYQWNPMSYHFNKCLLFGNFGLTSLCDFKAPPPLRQKMVLPSVDTLSPVSD